MRPSAAYAFKADAASFDKLALSRVCITCPPAFRRCLFGPTRIFELGRIRGDGARRALHGGNRRLHDLNYQAWFVIARSPIERFGSSSATRISSSCRIALTFATSLPRPDRESASGGAKNGSAEPNGSVSVR